MHWMRAGDGRSDHFFRRPFRSYCSGGVQQYLLENREILDIAFTPQGRDATKRMRAVVLDALGDGDQLCVFENLQMPVEGAVRQRAQLLQIAEQQSFRVGDERREDGEARPLVNEA